MPSNTGFSQLMEDEGFHPTAVNQKKQGGGREKNLTLGHGYNINAANDPEQDLRDAGVAEMDIPGMLKGEKEITKEQAATLFEISVQRAGRDAARVIPNFTSADPRVQDVFINMSFQLGAKGLRGFKRMREGAATGDLEKVARELLNSEMARSQSSNRAARLADQILEVAKEQKQAEQAAPAKPTNKQIYQTSKRNDLAQELSQLYSRETLVSDLADQVRKSGLLTESKQDETFEER